MDCDEDIYGEGCGAFYVPSLETNAYVIMVAELDVQDPYGESDQDQITVVVTNENQAPEDTADNGGDRDNQIEIYPVDDCDLSTFEATLNVDVLFSDPDKDNLRFDWYLDGDYFSDEQVWYNEEGMRSDVDLNFVSPGEYLLEVTVTDMLPVGEYYDDPISVFKTWNITVHPEGSDNIAPIAISTTEDTRVEHDSSPETTSALIDLSIDSSDDNGHELSYQWFLDGTEISSILDESAFTFEVDNHGSYDFIVSVCDCYTCTELEVPVLVEED